MFSWLRRQRDAADVVSEPTEPALRAIEATSLWPEPDADSPYAQSLSSSLYQQSSLFYSAVHTVAAVATEAKARVVDGDDEEIEVPAFTELLESPTRNMTYIQLLHTAFAQLIAHGVAWLEIRLARAQIEALAPIDPDRVERDGEAIIVQNTDGTRRRVPDRLMVQITWPMPSAGQDVGAMARAGQAADMDAASTSYAKRWFDQGVTSLLAISSQASAPTQATMDNLRMSWEQRHEGLKQSHKPLFLGGATDVKEISSAQPRDLALLDIRRRAEAEVASVVGAPPSAFGALIGLEHSTYNNNREQRRALWTGAIMPRLRLIADVLTHRVLREYYDVPDGARVDFATDHVRALQDSQEEAATVAVALYQGGVATLNEAREQAGLPETENGDEFLNEPEPDDDEGFGENEDIVPGIDDPEGLREQPHTCEWHNLREDDPPPRGDVADEPPYVGQQLDVETLAKGEGLSKELIEEYDAALKAHGAQQVARIARENGWAKGEHGKVINAAARWAEDITHAWSIGADRRLSVKMNEFALDALGPSMDRLKNRGMATTPDKILTKVLTGAPDNPELDSRARVVNQLTAKLRQGVTVQVNGMSNTLRLRMARIAEEAAHAGATPEEVASALEHAWREEMPWRARAIGADVSIRARNEAMLYTYAAAGADQVDVTDGEQYDEPCRTANGQRWSIEEARRRPLEHPHCIRQFWPIRPDDDD